MILKKPHPLLCDWISCLVALKIRRSGVSVALSVTLVLLCGAILLPGCNSIQPADESAVSHESPKRLLSDFEQAAHERDYARLLVCIHPKERDLYQEYYAICKPYAEKLDELGEVIRRKIGPDQATQYRRVTRHTGLPSPLRHARTDSGGINWDRVSIVLKTSTADVYVSDIYGTRVKLVLADGKWYVRTYDGGAPDRRHLSIFRNTLREFTRGVRQAIRDVESGKITQNNFQSFLAERFE